jgi:hypothetical protein
MNRRISKIIVLSLALCFCLSQSGCATIASGAGSLFGGAFSLLKLPFALLGEAFKLMQHVPVPPPWVFF